MRAATLYSQQHTWTGDKLVSADAKPALKMASDSADLAREVADTGLRQAGAPEEAEEEQQLREVSSSGATAAGAVHTQPHAPQASWAMQPSAC